MPVSFNFDSYLANGDFFCLLITFANSLYPDQDQQSISLDQDPNPWTLIAFLKEFFEKFNLKKQQQQTTENHEKLPSMQKERMKIR